MVTGAASASVIVAYGGFTTGSAALVGPRRSRTAGNEQKYALCATCNVRASHQPLLSTLMIR